MWGSLSLLSWTSIGAWEGTLVFKPASCATALTRALRPRPPAFTALPKTPSSVSTTRISVTPAVSRRQTVVTAAGLQMPSFQVTAHTSARLRSGEVTCQSRRPMKYHSASPTGSGSLKSDLLAFESYNY